MLEEQLAERDAEISELQCRLDGLSSPSPHSAQRHFATASADSADDAADLNGVPTPPGTPPPAPPADEPDHHASVEPAKPQRSVDGMAALDGVLERRKSKPAAAKSLPVTYRIDVKTGKNWGAGTDSNVSVQLVGANGTSDVFELGDDAKISKHRNKFEQAQVDSFEIEAPDVGALKELIVTMDGSGVSSKWQLHGMSVHDLLNSVTYDFPCDAWLDKGATASKILPCVKNRRFVSPPELSEHWESDGPEAQASLKDAPEIKDTLRQSGTESKGALRKSASGGFSAAASAVASRALQVASGDYSDDDEAIQALDAKMQRAKAQRRGKAQEYERQLRLRQRAADTTATAASAGAGVRAGKTAAVEDSDEEKEEPVQKWLQRVKKT